MQKRSIVLLGTAFMALAACDPQQPATDNGAGVFDVTDDDFALENGLQSDLDNAAALGGNMANRVTENLTFDGK